MTDFGPPIQLRPGPGGIIKVRRGGAVGNGNSGNGPKRFYTPPRAIRNVHGQHQPWPRRGKVIWDPRDPFIISLRAQHPAPAAWRTDPRVRMWAPKERPVSRKSKRVRKHFDFLDPRRSSFPPYIERPN